MMAEFMKVSYEQFKKDCQKLESSGALWFSSEEEIRKAYDSIQLPRRATDGSAGYDFYMPFPASFTTVCPVTFPTGVRVKLGQGTFLMCVPRSGLGFKYGMRLRNSVGIIDEDYFFADNEGHIAAKITCDEPFKLEAGDRFMQGIILPYLTVTNDNPIEKKRKGGFGSTDGAGQLPGQMSVDDIIYTKENAK